MRRLILLASLALSACTAGSSGIDASPDGRGLDVAPGHDARETADEPRETTDSTTPEGLLDAESSADEAVEPVDPVEVVEIFDTVETFDTVDASDTVPDVESACNPAPRPVILVHGVNGSSADYATMIARLQADGWPADWLFAFDAADPKWGCNVDNAAAIQQLVAHAMAVTGQPRVDLVAHSMGTLSSRYYVKNLGGQTQVNTYVTLGGMHHGLSSPCWNPLPICVWNELCQSGEFITELNADPATPGNLNWVSIYGTADETVPNESSYLEGAENIALEGIEHDGPNGLQERLEAYEEVRRVLQYPCW